ncbi:MAG: DUF2339 domain-containing protein, partial [Rufibacter sp.]
EELARLRSQVGKAAEKLTDGAVLKEEKRPSAPGTANQPTAKVPVSPPPASRLAPPVQAPVSSPLAEPKPAILTAPAPPAPTSAPVEPPKAPEPERPAPKPEALTPPPVPPAPKAPISPTPPLVAFPKEPQAEPAQEYISPAQRRVTAYLQDKPQEPEIEQAEAEPKDWEKFIGENLINKLGIVILVLGIGFFVKFAIDKDWISEIGRVAIGLLAGGALLGVAHRLRSQYAAFSSVLVGGGMAVLYFTIAIAFHEYHLFGQTVAFIIMVAITGFTIFLSIAYDRIELAILALIGGFGSPFMVSTGEGNYAVLFTFILILNLGILVLAYYKKWPLLNFIAYGFTILLYGGWLFTRVVDTPNAPYVGALVFATLFYLVFFLMNIIYNVKERQTFNAREIISLLSNTAMYYAAGMYVLANVAGGAYQGLFTLLLAIFNFGFAYTLYRSQRADRNLVYLLIGLVLTFLSLTAPVQLEGNHITLFWSLEAVVLLWLAQRANLQIIKVASCLVLGLMLVSLFMDWMGYTIEREPLPFLLNKYFITGMVSVAALGAVWFLLKRDSSIHEAPESSWQYYRTGVGVAWVVCLYLVLLLEFTYQMQESALGSPAKTFLLTFFHYIFLLGLLWRSKYLTSRVLRQIPLTLAAVGLFIYFIAVHPATMQVRDSYLSGNLDHFPVFFWHYLPLVAFLAIAVIILKMVHQRFGFEESAGKASLWLFSAMMVFLASAELEHLWLLAFHQPGTEVEEALRQIRKIGFPILWGIGSFVLMSLGMRHKMKTLRIISLSLFFLTLAKLFLIDVWDMSEGGKIAAFICLGVLLLIISFLYQKLKNIILEDDRKAPTSPADE